MVGVCCRPAHQEEDVGEPSLDSWKKPCEWRVGSGSALESAGSRCFQKVMQGTTSLGDLWNCLRITC